MVITDPKRVDEVLSRAVEVVYPTKEALREKMIQGERLRLYTGCDPNGSDLHIGHTTWMWKLREFQDLGHEVIMLMGSFTAMIGDPSDKLATRQPLTGEQVMENAKSYRKAAGKILRFHGENSVKVMWNHKWLAKMTFAQLLPLMSHFTVQQMIERDMFQKRYCGQVECVKCKAWNLAPPGYFGINESNDDKVFSLKSGKIACRKCGAETEIRGSNVRWPKPIALHEFMYPLMQGYDSVAMDVDLEVCGSDQTFNALAGRTLQRVLNNKEKFVLAVPLLEGGNGVKMGKSEGNAVPILSTPEDMFGKVMSLDDGFIFPIYENLTRVPLENIAAMKEKLAAGANPRDLKLKLAAELVRLYHSAAAAKRAKKHFEQVFQNHEKPNEIPEFTSAEVTLNVLDALVLTQLATSKGEARRLIEQGGVRVTDQPVTSIDAAVTPSAEGVIIQKGKRFFAKLKKA